MTNLDNPGCFQQIDPQDMIGFIRDLPEQFEAAWQRAQALDLPEAFSHVTQVILCGMGGSAIGADLLAAMVSEECRVPLFVSRGYDLPAFVGGPETLVIAISKSGNTEETLNAFQLAAEQGTHLLAITTGGQLTNLAEQFKAALWTFSYPSQPRAALGWLYGLLIGAFFRMGLIRDYAPDVVEAVTLMRSQSREFGAEVPTERNRAKRLASQLLDRLPVIWGAGLLEPVARRWKTQLNENAKTWAHFEGMPELNHNAVEGLGHPSFMPQLTVVQLLSSRYDGERVARRHTITREILLEKGISVQTVEAHGESRLAHQLTVLYLGDYVSFYLAMAYQEDPTPVRSIDLLKQRLAAADM